MFHCCARGSLGTRLQKSSYVDFTVGIRFVTIPHTSRSAGWEELGERRWGWSWVGGAGREEVGEELGGKAIELGDAYI